MKKILIALILTTVVRAVPVTTTLLEDAKLELTKGKGSVVLKAGSVVEVVGKDGDSIAVIFRSLQGRVLTNKTDYNGEPLKPAARKSKPEAKPEAPVVPAPPPAAKPAESTPTTPAFPASAVPASVQGRMVKKARDNEAKHNENLVEPTNSATAGGKKE